VPILSSSRPPASSVEHQRWVLGTPSELKLLRASLHRALTGLAWAPGTTLDEIPEKVVLVATELATNALRHGQPPTIVRLSSAEDHFILDVADHDPEIIPEYANERPPGAGGLGLQLARRMALDIGWYVDGETKHVWAQFPKPARSGHAEFVA
jgi:serine/threonine-protein kinase RsbW